jgi:uncharacterized membrane protein
MWGALAKNTVAPRLMDTVAPKVKDTLGPKIADAGGAGQLAKGAVSGVSGAGGGLLSKVGLDGGDGAEARGTGKGRRLPVQESVDVAVPLETAYNQFTQFEDFPEFMHRVEKVEQRDDTHLVWHEKIGGIRREWEAEINDQRPDERIAWKSLSGTQTTGVVTFHALSERLTRVEVMLDFQPQGLLEKTASGFRMSRRALKSDLMRFKAFVEMRDEETGAWRGRVEGFAKTVYDLSASQLEPDRTLLTGLMRTATTDEHARRWFRRYWTFGVGSGAHILVGALLDSARRAAEGDAAEKS